MEIRILNEIDYGSIRPALRALERADPNEPISVVINSGGGRVDLALDLAARLRDFADTTATVAGACSSAATVALAACRRRSAPMSARFTFHASAVDAADVAGRMTADVMQRLARDLSQTEQLVRARIREWTGVSAERQLSWEMGERTVTAEEMFEVGFLTTVFGPGAIEAKEQRLRRIVANARRQEAVEEAEDRERRRQKLQVYTNACRATAAAR